MTQHWKVKTDDDGIVWLGIDKADASANVLSSEVLMELDGVLKPLEANPPRGLILYSEKPGSFVMGADIKEFVGIDTPERAYELVRQGQQLFDRIEDLRCPTVAVINGVCLGGGLELAMACDYRVALAGDQRILGLPEVKLGLHPGFGGTVRIVRICGVRAGMPLMLTGNPITASKGRKIGLVDDITSDEGWRSTALALIRAAKPKQRAPLVDRLLDLKPARSFVRNMLLNQVRSKARKEHYPAPYAMIESWASNGASPKTGYEAEARSFANLMCTSTSRNLVRVFFLQSRLKAQGNKIDTKIKHVHVVGAGVMGGDIAAWCALRGHTVTLQDREQKYIDPAMDRANKLFGKRIRDVTKRADAQQRLRADVGGEGVRDADLIIEAIYENLEAKQELYRALQEKMKPGALLASNTSSIRLEELRTVLTQPRRFIGLHFFNPVAMLPLVEVIRCEDTDQEAMDIGFAFTKGIGKLPLECASSPGFVVNRILAPYMAEAMHLAEDGVPLVEIDRAAEAFGMPMGPVELVDSVGIDVALHVSKVLGAAMNRPVPERLSRMVDDGFLGRKSGQGFYRWEDGKAVKPGAENASVPADIQDRLILPMVNEAVACLHEGVVKDADLLDAGVIFGTGFAPFRGGPLHYALERGRDEVLAALSGLAQTHGDRFLPTGGWSDL
ncbi:MAG: enoyl-CoA hydratase/isomerase family protein [Gammaproteobacteria bacterium]|nr:enoyl-CoA hydratase/isomerase family protein [Gammaproteobacteria bacterium]MBT8110898.1 enoyl-CoA hydratase/isomerase family protein [Gammaproteobacteria bacterium]NND47080.1 3-hydroxyacyl-CoA dehydrogenase [Woeseiaceae bacterium]NNL45596.1 3-hydroxyacyl-CoA dehydrogenase [Woeseiaceae bacterium]